MPVPVNLFPHCLNTIGDFLLTLRTTFQVLPDSSQPLYQKCCFYNIRTVIPVTKAYSLSGFPIHPMSPQTIKPVCIFEKSHNSVKPLNRFPPGYKSSFGTHNNSHQSESGAS